MAKGSASVSRKCLEIYVLSEGMPLVSPGDPVRCGACIFLPEKKYDSHCNMQHIAIYI